MKLRDFPIYLLIAIFSLVFSSCSKNDDKDSDAKPSVDQSAFLANTSNIIYASYSDFNVRVNELSVSIDSFIAKPNLFHLNAAQHALKTAYVSWQRVNMYEFGPAESASLKSNLNIHPTDTTKIENNINSSIYNLSILSNKTAKGFPALDYLLNAGSDSMIVDTFQNSPSRKNYLHAVTDDIKTRSNQVYSEWGSYKNTFANNTGVDVGSSTGMLINALNLHYEKFFRDNKIGIPLGVRSSGIPRPEMVEAFYGQYSMELAVENFNAMQELYNGIDESRSNGYGLDDYLSASNASSLNESIKNQMTSIDSRLKALTDPLPAQIADQPNKVNEVYNEIQKLIVLWKVDMPSRMGVLITYQDNDGD